MQLGGKNANLIFDSSVLGCAGQLSINKRMCLDCNFMVRFNFCSHSRKKADVIQDFWFALYSTGNFFSFFGKHRGFWDFPITRGGSLSDPSMFAPNKSVNLSLDCFPPLHFSPLNTWDFDGRQR